MGSPFCHDGRSTGRTTSAQLHSEAEPRIVLDVTVCAAGRPLHLLNTHADRRTASRALGFANLRQIVKSDLGSRHADLGDLNEYPDAPGVRSLIDGGFIDLCATSPGTPWAPDASTTCSPMVPWLALRRPLASGRRTRATITLCSLIWPGELIS